ncbi:hypothetical protein BDF20DRAFT_908683 [Mycotypha africana]|uniref:uncharacterized protein n=1 Tax=Mycotypha africana TaxID=64632 RepID=UPI002300AC5C|nr:uncharacterized protein BDF20DRAFT_908683 [Mycotypha africana]KAI8990841.1 hypothetical protein BDF20DRAFT_908683 [Mycotypha africana]
MPFLPGEILCNIAQSLSTQDLFQCLTVCQNWYLPLLCQMYQHIIITNNRQAQLLFEALQQHQQQQHIDEGGRIRVGYYVKSISFSARQRVHLGLGIQLFTKDAVNITQEMLDIIEQYCPYIRQLDFDHTQWKEDSKKSLSLPSKLLHSLRKLPVVDFSIYQTYNTTVNVPYHDIALSPTTDFQLTYLTTMHIRNNTDLFEPMTFKAFLMQIPRVRHLTFERDSIYNKYRTPILSLGLLRTILTALPQLETLQFTKHFNFGIDLLSSAQLYYNPDDTFFTNHHQQQNHLFDDINSKCSHSLQHLKLEGTLRSHHWLIYIAQSLRQLRSIDFDLVLSPYSSSPSLSYNSPMMPSTHFLNAVIKESFIKIAAECRHLSQIRIRSISTPLWLSPIFLNTLCQRSTDNTLPITLDAQLYGLDSLGVQNAITTLTHGNDPPFRSIHLASLRLPIWKTNYPHSPIKSWTITLAPLMTKFHQTLTHLELDAVSLSFNTMQPSYSNHNDNHHQTQPFELDIVLDMFTNLVTMKLSGSAVELSKTNKSSCSMTTKMHLKFKELQLFKMLFTTDVMEYLSAYCPQATRLVMYECRHWYPRKEGYDVTSNSSNFQASNIGKVPLYLKNLNLEFLVLYRLQHAYQTTVESRAPGARFLRYTNTTKGGEHWFHLAKWTEDQSEASAATTATQAAAVKRLTSTHTIQKIVERSYQYVLGLCNFDSNMSSTPSYQRRIEYHTEEEWEKDLALGYIDLQCKGVGRLFMDEYSLDI